MRNPEKIRTLALTITGVLLGVAAAPAAPMGNVPEGTAGYRESVRCMPEIEGREAIRADLESQEESIVTVDLRASIDGDPEPDVLLFGADTYRESVACTTRMGDLLSSLGASPEALPDLTLESQAGVERRELPDDVGGASGTE